MPQKNLKSRSKDHRIGKKSLTMQFYFLNSLVALFDLKVKIDFQLYFSLRLSSKTSHFKLIFRLYSCSWVYIEAIVGALSIKERPSGKLKFTANSRNSRGFQMRKAQRAGACKLDYSKSKKSFTLCASEWVSACTKIQ
jgi:hypothetical protein